MLGAIPAVPAFPRLKPGSRHPGSTRASQNGRLPPRGTWRRRAHSGGGHYFELDRESDRDIADEIIDATRCRAGVQGVQESTEPLYWRLLFVSACLICLGSLFLQEPAELWIQLAGAGVALLIVTSLIR